MDAAIGQQLNLLATFVCDSWAGGEEAGKAEAERARAGPSEKPPAREVIRLQLRDQTFQICHWSLS